MFFDVARVFTLIWDQVLKASHSDCRQHEHLPAESLHKLVVVICSNALQKRSKELAQRFAVEEASVRRSERVRTAPRLTGFLAYVNKLRTS